MNKELLQATQDRINRMPRVRLGQFPTPLMEAPRLSEALGGPRILFKRDDLSNVGLGGNKARKLEYVIGRAVADGADTLVICGGFQSNLARIAAAMGSQLGLQVELILGGVPGEPRHPVGNLLLDHLYGANVRFVETLPRWEFGDTLANVEQELIAEGRKPFVVPLGASSPEGMASYVEASRELYQQLECSGVAANYLYVGVGSGGTLSGLALAHANLELPYALRGISVSRASEHYRNKLPADMGEAALQLGLSQVPAGDSLDIDDRFIGGGYGETSDGSNEAIALVAKTEGVLLDPVYSGKCMHGLIQHIREGRIAADDTVVFLHTGGWPALFSYEAETLGVSTEAHCLPPVHVVNE
ncbi:MULTISPECIES: 1-aminocyclopropane-1-carboxylate deaminase/D-cysteine desulfhydrase [Spongiibacter]|uniref:1-aminocyclopropane-1-carboxylate deaminase/D-cysteine desulfhydrase n=1 Tax=Spongiibacter TaxID=630749 RepID=UPI00235316E1|nr:MULTISPECIES: D-cysteine desulfhydrase family protein [Spongiibacter]